MGPGSDHDAQQTAPTGVFTPPSPSEQPWGPFTFYMGSHQPHWLATTEVPLFVSHRRLAARRSFPRAATAWALDSGAFSELVLHGGWRTTPEAYNSAVRRYDHAIGNLDWTAPMDWPCEPDMVHRTGLSVEAHQHKTVANFVQLQQLWDHEESASPYMPVLQGWEPADYLHCWDLYGEAGVDLADYAVVGVGSVCRRQHTSQIGEVLGALLARDPLLPIHAFGLKMHGLRTYGHLLCSADSCAWSFQARRNPPRPGCTHAHCSNCLDYALDWRSRALRCRRRVLSSSS